MHIQGRGVYVTRGGRLAFVQERIVDVGRITYRGHILDQEHGRVVGRDYAWSEDGVCLAADSSDNDLVSQV